jgi:2-polyprenyl-6-methoxyphenol hydroxylase-like FAD-dependent oxidoreductase
MVPQSITEAVLNDRLTAAGGRVARGYEAIGLTGAAVTFATGEQIAARYVVAADGMNSTIRRLAGIPAGDAVAHASSAGSPPATSLEGESFVLADVRVDGGPPRDEVVLYFSRAGLLVWAPLPDGTVRIVAAADDAPERAEPAYVQALLQDRGPLRVPAHVTEVTWSSRFRVHHRVAETFRAGPVLLAGDAGHVHSPAGGQGMNLGIKDALALAEALVETLNSGSEDPLDRYATERRIAARQVVGFAARLTRLATVPAPVRPIRNAVLSTLARVPAVRSGLAHRLSGLQR